MPNDADTPTLRQTAEDLALVRDQIEAALVILSAAVVACLAGQEAAAQAREARASKPPRTRQKRKRR